VPTAALPAEPFSPAVSPTAIAPDGDPCRVVYAPDLGLFDFHNGQRWRRGLVSE
jgi:hypothetical protein